MTSPSVVIERTSIGALCMASIIGSYANAYHAMVTASFVLFSPVRLDFAFYCLFFCSGAFSPLSAFLPINRAWPVISDSWRFLLYISVCASLKRPWLGHGPYTIGAFFAGGSKIHRWGRDCRLLLWAALTKDEYIYLVIASLLIQVLLAADVTVDRSAWK